MPDHPTDENGRTRQALMLGAVALFVLIALFAAFPRVREEARAWRGFAQQRMARQFTPASALPKRDFTISLPLPASERPTRAVRVAVSDRSGQREVYRGTSRSGLPVTIPFSGYGERGEIELQVYLDGKLYNRQKL